MTPKSSFIYLPFKPDRRNLSYRSAKSRKSTHYKPIVKQVPIYYSVCPYPTAFTHVIECGPRIHQCILLAGTDKFPRRKSYPIPKHFDWSHYDVNNFNLWKSVYQQLVIIKLRQERN